MTETHDDAAATDGDLSCCLHCDCVDGSCDCPRECHMCNTSMSLADECEWPDDGAVMCWECQHTAISQLAMMVGRLRQSLVSRGLNPQLQTQALALLQKYGLQSAQA